jgi:pyruvate,orthophosphate dikinase
MYATTVLDCRDEQLGEDPAITDAAGLRADVERLRGAIRAACGADVPDDPAMQLRAAIEAVFRSCGSARAQAYRRRERMSENLATAVNVQAMVFGNRGAQSGTGVVFTRDPATGHPTRYGDYLRRAQGEDVVAGIARTQPIGELATEMPAVWSDLDAILSRLERHYADICDVEFTHRAGPALGAPDTSQQAQCRRRGARSRPDGGGAQHLAYPAGSCGPRQRRRSRGGA